MAEDWVRLQLGMRLQIRVLRYIINFKGFLSALSNFVFDLFELFNVTLNDMGISMTVVASYEKGTLLI